ncbi:GLUTAMATE RECEPTOR 3.7 [Salix koriyanagi]|uniref:GLUTAMATE RECEPTOR 3.7 n=1 Tax=Salix koriyanagi TaxID=2511006 RepID=A0A9Q0YUW2_9ROSI|nr:GLUTAMATE RECEPTOR 3.7 [Salix koriyanagi]
MDILNKSKLLGPRVYVVHVNPDPELRIFTVAQKLQMMTDTYTWLATDWLSATLDSFPPAKKTSLGFLQGVVGLRQHTPESNQKRAFMSRWKKMQQNGSASSELNTYGLQAYDTIEKLKVFNGGNDLLDILLQTNFTGLSGQIQFNQDRNVFSGGYDVINMDGVSVRTVGYWSNVTGFSLSPPDSRTGRQDSNCCVDQRLQSVTWPGGKSETPRGWVIAADEKPLRIGVPNRASFTEFVTEVHGSHKINGYCIDVFLKARELVPYHVPYTFQPFGNGRSNPKYDDLVKMVAADVFDAAVGDIAIVTNRTKIVDFSQPYASTGLVIVAPIRNSKSSAWVFLKPFTAEMWCVTAAFFLIIAVVIWILEHRVNDDFRGPPRRQIVTMFMFSFSTLFKKNQETTLSSPITGIESLIASRWPIGYQTGSFAYDYLSDSLYISRSRLVALGSPEEYESALRLGPGDGGVAAIVDELPYVELFLSRQKDFGIIGQPFTRGGWGFAFRRESPLALDISTAILKLSENGELQRIHEKWFCKMGCHGEKKHGNEPLQLNLTSFWGLYLLSGAVTLTALMVFLLRMIRQFVRYKRRERQHSSSPSPISTSTRCSEVIYHFFDFIDKREEAIKKLFNQCENPHPQPINAHFKEIEGSAIAAT